MTAASTTMPAIKCKTQIVLVFTKWPDCYFADDSLDGLRSQARRYFSSLPLLSPPELFAMPLPCGGPLDSGFRACSYTLESELQRLSRCIQQSQRGVLHRAQDSLAALQRFWSVIQHCTPVFLQSIDPEG